MKYEHLTNQEMADAYKARMKALEANLFELDREKQELEACRGIAADDDERQAIDKIINEHEIKISYGRARMATVKRLYQERADVALPAETE